MASERILEKIHIQWNEVDAVGQCKQHCCGCRVYVYTRDERIKFQSHRSYLQQSAGHGCSIRYPLVLLDGSNRDQLRKSKQAVKTALSVARKKRAVNDAADAGYAVFSHKKARKKRSWKLNRSLPSGHSKQ
mmetsp:Transcript_9592/g.15435  ORF Transcript_9592/g.15435 Transcript_9592/m.15435 type:complete len:131 (+) Transcript_9592:107-499(+)